MSGNGQRRRDATHRSHSFDKAVPCDPSNEPPFCCGIPGVIIRKRVLVATMTKKETISAVLQLITITFNNEITAVCASSDGSNLRLSFIPISSGSDY